MDRPEIAPRHCTLFVPDHMGNPRFPWILQKCGHELTEQHDNTAGWFWECPADGDHAQEYWRRSRGGPAVVDTRALRV